ncbi:MAG: cyanophycinase [Erysipelotrichaceae bacterium]|nr:cyanophycinase [Erysipelotrichaceae bacterium]MDP3305223.1 cyanophycinase [Erysipelotrichaceae bacterium]
MAIGGHEDNINDHRILSEILLLIKKEKKNIEIITAASKYPDEAGETYLKAFEDSNHTVKLMNISDREQTTEESLIKRITKADIIFFTGGSQLRITSILGGSLIEKEILRKYEEEYCVIAGTSAGANFMSETMVYRGEVEEALYKDTINMSAGIGLIDNVVLDTHFVERGRFSRLMQIVCMNSRNTGIGLGEDAGLVIEGGRILRAIGRGITVILDGHQLKYTNVAEIDSHEAIAIENLIIHTIVDGYGYDLGDKKYLKPDDLEKLHKAGNDGITHENS